MRFLNPAGNSWEDDDHWDLQNWSSTSPSQETLPDLKLGEGESLAPCVIGHGIININCLFLSTNHWLHLDALECLPAEWTGFLVENNIPKIIPHHFSRSPPDQIISMEVVEAAVWWSSSGPVQYGSTKKYSSPSSSTGNLAHNLISWLTARCSNCEQQFAVGLTYAMQTVTAFSANRWRALEGWRAGVQFKQEL